MIPATIKIKLMITITIMITTRLKHRALRKLLSAILLLVCIAVSAETASARDVAVVTIKNSHVQVMKAVELAKIIRTTHKGFDTQDLTIVITDPSSPEMRIVAEKLLSLSTEDFRKLIETTNKTRPTFLVVSNDDEVLKTVQSNPSAIGLVNVYSINSGVDVLKIDGKLPLESGYLLHSQ
jgi:ABC-type phosphate transport system substrate-binding protein